MRFPRSRWVGTLLALSLVATACGGDDAGDESDADASADETPGEEADETPGEEVDGDAAPADDGMLVVGATEKPSTIDPAEVYEKFASDLLFNTADRLVELEPGTGDVIPGLASEWEISDDGLTYTFTLHDGEDGSDLTSEDVK